MDTHTHRIDLTEGLSERSEPPGRPKASRTVSVDIVGPQEGPAVVLCHAAPGSRLFDPEPLVTEAADVRLITIDRPGYGDSSPLPDGEVPTITRFADDAAAVLDELGVNDAKVVGWSAGGRIAAALAASRPDLVRSLWIVATPAPDEAVPWIPDEQRGAIEVMKADPAAAVGQMGEMLRTMTEHADEAVSMVSGGPADDLALRDDALRARLETMLGEAFRQGPIGLAADIVSYTVADWGFDAATIAVPTTCVYGEHDLVVTPAHGEWWMGEVPDAALEVVRDAGHLVITRAWPSICA